MYKVSVKKNITFFKFNYLFFFFKSFWHNTIISYWQCLNHLTFFIKNKITWGYILPLQVYDCLDKLLLFHFPLSHHQKQQRMQRMLRIQLFAHNYLDGDRAALFFRIRFRKEKNITDWYHFMTK